MKGTKSSMGTFIVIIPFYIFFIQVYSKNFEMPSKVRFLVGTSERAVLWIPELMRSQLRQLAGCRGKQKQNKP